jgi:glycogen phosphorylase
MTADRSIAYFSMEIGLISEMPTYAGGLGVLAGDTLRAAADLGLPFVGLTLLYRQGFFRQQLSDDGQQSESPDSWDPGRFLEKTDIRLSIDLEGRSVAFTAWCFMVRGARGDGLPVYLMDADLPENDPYDRGLTGQLYGGDQRYRLRQEALLGLGGIKLLRALGYDSIQTYHLNEGHSALLALSLLDELVPAGDFLRAGEDQFEAIRRRCVFTTHTPVPAGHDKFPLWLVREVLGEEMAAAIIRLPFVEDDVLNMTYLGLFFARYVNGVAQRHGEVAQALYPGYQVSSITNGVHASTWASPPFEALFDRELPGWRADNSYLRRAINIHVDHVLEAHSEAKRGMVAEVERRTGHHLDPSVMTIGFARRSATYKRPDFVFADLDELRDLVQHSGPLQFVFAGKAHPQDLPAKDLIKRVFSASEHLSPDLPVVWLEDYDMALGRTMTSGVDLWLNNPNKPLEASGTSGMKAAMNGVPSLSVLDGWWPEGWIEGVTGWSIGDGPEYESDAADELSSLYNKLRYVILPLFYGSPASYGRVMRSTIALNGSYFTAQRMVQQYALNAYRVPPTPV